MVNRRVWNAVLGCNLKNDRMISVHFQGKPFNITVIQVYVPTSNIEEAEVEQGLGPGGDGDDRGWDGWMASLTRWTWVWVNSGVGDGQGGLACCDSWSRKESDMTGDWNELNWNELNNTRVSHGTVVRSSSTKAGDARDMVSIPWSWRSPGEGNGNPYSSILTWKISWTEQLGRLQSTGSQRVGHNWVHTHIHTHR